MATNKNFEVKNGLSVGGTERISSAGAFSGSLASGVTATTQSATDNSTKIATTAYTDAAITAVIGGAPGTLDTLNELAAAINDDASYASTLTTALATKLPLAGGAMTGSLLIDAGNNGLDIRLGTDKRVTWSGGIGEIGNTAGFQAVNTAGSALSGFGIRASELKFATGSATRLTIDATGDVTVPGKVLVNTDIRLGSEGVRLSSDGNGEFGIGYGQTATNSRFSVYNNTAVAFRVLPNGNVGIGTTGPYFPFHVQGPTGFNGEAKNNGLLFDTASATTGTGGGLAFGGYSNGTGGDIYHFGNIQGIKENSTAGNYASAMIFSTRANGATPLEQMRISSTGKVGIGTDSPNKPLEISSNDRQLRLSTGSEPTNYYTEIFSPYNSTNPFTMEGYYNGTSVKFIDITAAGGFSGAILKVGQGMSYTSLYTGTTERISIQPTQGSTYENIHENFTGNLNLSLLRGMRFARAGSIADDTKIKLFQGSYTYSGGTIDYVITDGGGSQNHVGSGTINWYSRESTCHFTLTGTNVSSKIVVNADTSTGTYADGKFTIAIRATNGDSHITIMNRLGSLAYVGLKISVNYVG